MISSFPKVQRTLILAWGDVAQQAGDTFRQLLAQRQGPAAAVAFLTIDDGAPLADALSEALETISQATAPARLTQSGWQLARHDEIRLYLLGDVASGQAERLFSGLAQAQSAARRQLGSDVAPICIWIAPTWMPHDLVHCLQITAQRAAALPYGAFLIGYLNEQRLQLSDADQLAHHVAHVLWTLIATPIGRLLDDLMIPPRGIEEDPAIFHTIGLTEWEWAPRRVQTVLAKEWMKMVITQWLRHTDAAVTPDAVAGWLSAHNLTPAQIAQRWQAEETPNQAAFNPAAWQWPPPWRLRALWQEMGAENETKRAKQAAANRTLAPQLEPVWQEGHQAMRRHARRLLDEQAVGGVNRTERWATALAAACDDQCADLDAQLAQHDQTEEALALEHGRLSAVWQEQMEQWPPASGAAWRRAILQPWQWPRLLWTYRQLIHLGRQMSLILTRQAARRNERLHQRQIHQCMIVVQRSARQLAGSVNEVEEMLRYLLRQLDAASPAEPPDSRTVALIDALLAQWRPIAPQEAVEAAQQIGRLGQQIQALDDEQLAERLQEIARERVDDIASYTTGDVLSLLYPHPTERARWWRNRLEKAIPLWPYDSAQLPEAVRARQTSYVLVCGAGAPTLQETLSLTKSGRERPVYRWLASTERQRLTIVRWRAGLTAAALLPEEIDDEPI